MKIKETLKRKTKWMLEGFKNPKFCIWAIVLLGLETILFLWQFKAINNFLVVTGSPFKNTLLVIMNLIMLRFEAEIIIDTLKDVKKN